MAVTLRLSRHGRQHIAKYRIVAADKAFKRDGRFLEVVGIYNPNSNPPSVVLKEDKIRHWIGIGARPSTLVRSLIIKLMPGLIEERETHQRKKILELRKKRKQRLNAAAKEKKAPSKAKK